MDGQLVNRVVTLDRPLLSLSGLCKSFAGVPALDEVELHVVGGEIHGLLGENGSGKSTLIKVLAGYHTPDAGSLELDGQRVELPIRSKDLASLGLAFVHQDLGLILDLSVTENFFIGRISQMPAHRFVSMRSLEEEVQRVLDQYELAIDARATVESLKPVERALLAIVRALYSLQEGGERNALLVLDEPTVFLPADQVAVLFGFMRTIAASGSSVLLVSHDLDEIKEITDRVTVLRDGRVIGTRQTEETSTTDLVEMIVGHELRSDDAASVRGQMGDAVVEVCNLSTAALKDVSFSLHEGEVLGVTGLVGSGFEDIPYALFGARIEQQGELRVLNKSEQLDSITPKRAMEYGFALVPGDRLTLGAVGSLSVEENVSILMLRRFLKRGRLRWNALRERVSDLIQQFDVRPRRPDVEYATLSGGNQQKALMAKWAEQKPRVLLLHEPTQGVDVGAREQIWSAVRALQGGTAVICASSDYHQLSVLCDRVLIVTRGTISGELRAPLSKERIAVGCVTGQIPDEFPATAERGRPQDASTPEGDEHAGA